MAESKPGRSMAGWLVLLLIMVLLAGCDRSQPSGTAQAAPVLAVAAQAAAPVATPVVPALAPEPLSPSPSVPAGPPTVALFVKNRAGAKLDPQVGALEALMESRATEKGYSTVSRENVINAVATLASQGANVGDERLAGAELDKLLSNNTSILRLGQNLGAHYVLVATLVSYSQDKKAFEGYGVKTLVLSSTLRASYVLLDVVKGASVPGAGGTVQAVHQTRVHEPYAEDSDLPGELVDEATAKLTEKLPPAPTAAPAVSGATLTVRCTIQGLEVPDVVRNASGEYMVTANRGFVRAGNASVELDGVIIGTATGTFKDVPPGLHKIRVTCKGSQDWNDYEGTVKVVNGMVLDIDLHHSDKGHLKWKDLIGILQGLKANTKLTDAQVKVMEGLAQTLRQSGYKVDLKGDVKIDSNLEGLNRISLW